MKTRKRIVAAVWAGLAAVGGATLAASVPGGPELISFPQGFEKWMLYATVEPES